MREDKFKAVSVLDPAIDTERMLHAEIVTYWERRDFSKVSAFIKPGERPTVFCIREVPHALWDSYVTAGATTERECYRRAFMCGVEKVENLMQPDGVSLPSWEPVKRIGQHTVMSDEEANERFSPAEREEIGCLVYQHSFLARRIEPCFPLPSLCLAQLVRRPFRSAAASPSDAVESNAKPLESTPPSPAEIANV